jgi:hypothetical protein
MYLSDHEMDKRRDAGNKLERNFLWWISTPIGIDLSVQFWFWRSENCALKPKL